MSASIHHLKRLDLENRKAMIQNMINEEIKEGDPSDEITYFIRGLLVIAGMFAAVMVLYDAFVR